MFIGISECCLKRMVDVAVAWRKIIQAINVKQRQVNRNELY